MPKNCSTCRYYRDPGTPDALVCHRFPRDVAIERPPHGHWCGEWQQTIREASLAGEAFDAAMAFVCDRGGRLGGQTYTQRFIGAPSVVATAEALGGWIILENCPPSERLALRDRWVKTWEELDV